MVASSAYFFVALTCLLYPSTLSTVSAKQLTFTQKLANESYYAALLTTDELYAGRDDIVTMAKQKGYADSVGLDFLESWVDEPDGASVIKVKGMPVCFGVFRATKDTLADWTQNLDRIARRIPGSDCQVGNGFYVGYYTSYRKNFEESLEKCLKTCPGQKENEKCSLIFTGRSQGAAIAVVAGIARRDLNPVVMTYGGPRVVYPRDLFSPNFICRNINPSRNYRFHNVDAGRYDIVPNIVALGARHIGHTIILREDGPIYAGLNRNTDRKPNKWKGAHGIQSHLEKLVKIRDDAAKSKSKEIVLKPLSNNKECREGDECISGRCHNHKCLSRRKPGKPCHNNNDCDSRKCLLRSTIKRCGDKNGKMPNGGPCDSNSHCQSGRCEGTWPPYRCHARLNRGRFCSENSDCKSNRCSWWKCK